MWVCDRYGYTVDTVAVRTALRRRVVYRPGYDSRTRVYRQACGQSRRIERENVACVGITERSRYIQTYIVRIFVFLVLYCRAHGRIVKPRDGYSQNGCIGPALSVAYRIGDARRCCSVLRQIDKIFTRIEGVASVRIDRECTSVSSGYLVTCRHCVCTVCRLRYH